MNPINAVTSRILSMVMFSLAFSVIGYVVPEVYFRYLDRTQYHQIINPVDIEEREIFACNNVTAVIPTKSLITTSAVSVRELVLVNGNVEVYRARRDVVINKEDVLIRTRWEIPCDTMAGEYYFRGVLVYIIRGQEKVVPFYSVHFNVLDAVTN